MVIRYCDKCKKDITTGTMFKIIVSQKYTDLVLSTAVNDKEFELCSICKEEVLDLLKGKHEATKKHR